MNIYNIIEEIEKVDPDFQDRISPRRAAIKNITSFGSKVAVAALPFALGTMIKKAYAQTAASAAVLASLNFALTLEYLEASFYDTAVATSGLIPSANLAFIQSIQADEDKHVTFLQNAITAAGGTPVAKGTYDFTGGGKTTGPTGNGPFPTVMSNFETFLAVAETFEDTGVRAYKGQAPVLIGNALLTAALNIHAVEARHAAAIRYLRTSLGYATVKPWIVSPNSSLLTAPDKTGVNSNDTGITQVNANYGGSTSITTASPFIPASPENMTTQNATATSATAAPTGGVNILTLPSVESTTSTSVAVATAAFDEPLAMADVTAILIPAFII